MKYTFCVEECGEAPTRQLEIFDSCEAAWQACKMEAGRQLTLLLANQTNCQVVYQEGIELVDLSQNRRLFRYTVTATAPKGARPQN